MDLIEDLEKYDLKLNKENLEKIEASPESLDPRIQVNTILLLNRPNRNFIIFGFIISFINFINRRIFLKNELERLNRCAAHINKLENELEVRFYFII